MKLFAFYTVIEASLHISKPGDKKFTMDNVKYNPHRDGKNNLKIL